MIFVAVVVAVAVSFSNMTKKHTKFVFTNQKKKKNENTICEWSRDCRKLKGFIIRNLIIV